MTVPGATAAAPPPDPIAAALSQRLQDRIRTAIAAAGGALGFDRYMQMALYEPGLGYYSAGLPRFGAAGDFITAPLVSPLFARTLARQCAAVLETVGDGGEILELGAGSGHMAADLLRELADLGRLPARYCILEVSGALRAQQRETLIAAGDDLMQRVQWLDRLPDAGLRGVILANEVMDALPVQRFRRRSGGVRELAVTLRNEGFDWTERAADQRLDAAVAAIEGDVGPLAEGYLSEWCPLLGPWIASLAETLRAGAALLIDYGYPRREYYHAERRMGTLMCHYRHRAHDDPLVLTGLQDITAFVDFTAAARAGCEAGLDLLGYATQGHFLMGAGLPELLQRATERDPGHAVTLTQQAKTLMWPDAMGERFKVLALGRDVPDALDGFSLFDHRDRLQAAAAG